MSDLEESALKGEILMRAMTSYRYTSHALIDTLVPLMKKICPVSRIMHSICLDRLKSQEIVNRVLAPCQKDKLQTILQNQKFSVIVDESTDKSMIHCMCIVVRYFDYENEEVKESLWKLMNIYDTEGSLANAEQLTEKIINSFEHNSVPLVNIYGFCADTCSLMKGDNCSISVKLKEIISHLIIIKCPCHMEQLCAKSAMHKLPSNCTEFMPNVVKYLSSSSKKLSAWRFLQKKANVSPLAAVRPGFIRWIPMKATVDYHLYR